MIRIRIERVDGLEAEHPMKETILLLEQNLPDERFSQFQMWAILSALNDPMLLADIANGPATSGSSLPADCRPTERG
jgi:hypothetical protein